MRKQPMRQGNSNGLLTVIGLGVQSKCSHTCEACLQTLTLPVEAKDKEGKGKNEKKRQAFAHVSTMLPESGSRPFFCYSFLSAPFPKASSVPLRTKDTLKATSDLNEFYYGWFLKMSRHGICVPNLNKTNIVPKNGGFRSLLRGELFVSGRFNFPPISQVAYLTYPLKDWVDFLNHWMCLSCPDRDQFPIYL